MTVVFQAGDLAAESIPDAETEVVQPLLERCEEFYQLTYGRPALPGSSPEVSRGAPSARARAGPPVRAEDGGR